MKSAVVAFALPLISTLIAVRPTEVQAQARSTTAQPPSTVARPDSIQDSGFYNYWANMNAQGKAGGVLLGKVALEGEPLPWEPLLVAVDCKGTVVNLTQTDLEGRFVIRFIDPNGVEKSPVDAKRQMETKYEGCVVRGNLAGFRSSETTLKVKNFRDDPDLGTITLFPEDRGTGMEVSVTTKAAPPAAMKAFEKARGDWLENNPAGAQKNLRKAVELDPGFAEAWLQLGKLREATDPQGAKEDFAKALAADPKFILPYEQMAVMAVQAQEWREAIGHTSRALELDPAGTPQLWYYDALARFQLGQVDEAEASAKKGLAIDPRHSVPNAEQLLAVVLARKSDYAGAVEHLKNCLAYTSPGPNADLLKQQIAQLQRKAGGK
jgi:tetratricopeptide (TPR) repeat protein